MRNSTIIKHFLLAVMMTVSSYGWGQFLKASGKKIVNDSNQEVILRGMGLGGWMIQEGYMLQMEGFANPQREVRAKIQGLIGATNTDNFYSAWLSNMCTKREIDSLAKWGFNSVRLPMHYNLYTLPIESEPTPGVNTWLDKGFVMTDSLIKWCAANQMYVILDLHAAPGGQGHDAAISDYDPGKPSIWESAANKSKTVELWRKLATRYVNEPWVGGYDLINEPNWNFTDGGNANGCSETATSNQPLWDLYKSITTAIRSVDTKHIIFVEGNCWANNHAGFSPWDNNLVVSFHKYWSYNDTGSIQGMLSIRDNNNVPLWLGESGENSNQWYKDAIDLLENNNIGWSWWTLKKVGSPTGTFTVEKSDDYATLLNYWKNGGTTPSQSFAYNTLMKLADAIKAENCTTHKDVIDAMFRQHNSIVTKPFVDQHIPGVIHLSDFDLGTNGYAYNDTDPADYHVSSGTYTAWNSGWIYRNDGVDLELTKDIDARSNGIDVGWTANDEWMQYTVQVDSTAAYNITLRYAAAAGTTSVKLQLNGGDVGPAVILPTTSGLQKWGSITFNDIILSKGTQKLRLAIVKAGMNLGFLDVALSKLTTAVPFQALSAATSGTTEEILLNVNKAINSASLNASEFTSSVNGVATTLTDIHPANGGGQLSITLATKIFDGDVIKVSYAGSDVLAFDGTALAGFTDMLVKNNLPLHQAIPGRIQAESFSVNNGMSAETCSDTGGGQDMGYTSVGDYLDYQVRVATAGKYVVEARVACNATAGSIEVQQLDDTNTVINKVKISIPVTGGWQTWTTVKGTLTLASGISRIRVKIIQPEFNLNWFNFTEVVISGVNGNRTGSLYSYPNPASEYISIAMPDGAGKKKTVTIQSLEGVTVRRIEIPTQTEESSIYVGDLGKGIYILELNEGAGQIWRNKIVLN